MLHKPTRRSLLALVAAGASGPAPAADRAADRADAVEAPFRGEEFATVGVFGVDWLLDPMFTRLLDNFAASPGAVRGVRAFGVLSLGPDRTFPTTSGHVWDDPAAKPDFSRSLAALDTLVSRNLVPFLPLCFFPRAVSPMPTVPPADWTNWESLVRGFLDAAVGRFGAAEVVRWWFEVWNEPNVPPFWGGDFDQYLTLYRVTAAAVRQTGHRIRLGGPVVAYTPGDGPALMERFLRMLASEPALQCDFLSYHRKGVWSNGEREPDVQRLVEAAETTAEAVLRLVPQRTQGLALVNDEADMRVGFDIPFEPRMTAQSAAWLAAITIAHDALSVRYAAHGMRFLAASDNGNQQLAQGSFDGRRTLMTPIAAAQDLLKLPVYGFYEMLRLMRGTRRPIRGTLPAGVYGLATGDDRGIAVLLTRYAEPGTAALDVALDDVPWPTVNVATFCIDAVRTNPRAGGTDPASMRRHAELGVQHELRTAATVTGRTIRLTPLLENFATVLIWITPHGDAVPGAPSALEAKRDDHGVLLRWTPAQTPDLYSYEVTRNGIPIGPMPLRAAMWLDASPPPGRLRYTVTSRTVSGRASPGSDVTLD